jgi:hypothetical protein
MYCIVIVVVVVVVLLLLLLLLLVLYLNVVVAVWRGVAWSFFALAVHIAHSHELCYS